MTEILIYKAECGDATRIRFTGVDGKPHNLLIDGGFERTFRFVLKEEIEKLIKNGEFIDAWVVSHIHDDHIGGVKSYVKTVCSGEWTDQVCSWYYNVPRLSATTISTDNVSDAKSISQGDLLTSYLHSISALPSEDITTVLAPINLWGMKIRVLSPNPASLLSLRRKYPPGSLTPLEGNENDTVSEAKGAVQSDYHQQLDSFDLNKWEQDDSIENGSSIALSITVGTKKMLWLADAFPNIVCEALRGLGYSTDNPLRCEWVKVAHHGSGGNNSNELFSLIRCQQYIFTANGENKHRLPTKECIARLLLNKFRPKETPYQLYFTDDNTTLREIFSVDGEDVFDRLDFTAHYLASQEKFWRLTL